MGKLLDKNKKQMAVHSGPGFALGRHLTIEYYDCAPDVLLDKDRVEKMMLRAAQESGATIVSSSFHQFEPQGVSGVVIIAESHFTVHAWPEHNYAAVDIFTCADKIDLDTAVHCLKTQFLSQNVLISSDQNRGIMQPWQVSDKAHNSEKLMEKFTLPITWKKVWQNTNPWGLSTSVDVYGCSSGMIEDPDCIKRLVSRLKEMLGLIIDQENAPLLYYNENQTVAGFSMIEPREAFGICGYFSHETHAAYLDIFSCNKYEPRQIAELALSYLQGRHYKMQVTLRQ